MAFKPACVETVTDKLIVFSEQRSKLTLLNNDSGEVQKVQVDDCEITSGMRCDHLAIKANCEYYIELKGQDIKHAIKQIERTIKTLSNSNNRKISFIICTRSPLAAAEIQNLQLKFRRDFNSNLIVKNSPYTHPI
jgi:hypothetical protein